MIPPDRILQYAIRSVRSTANWRGVRCLVTAGPTREPIDPVRYIGNRSSGKMGYALATELWQRGADVVLVSGPVCLPPPEGVEVVRVNTTQEMLRACSDHFRSCDVGVFAAAPADFRSAESATSKIKKSGSREGLRIGLVGNPDIAATLGGMKRTGQITVGFAAETDDLIANARAKLVTKQLDMIVANDVTSQGAGFEVDTNIATIISRNGGSEALNLMSKPNLARIIVDRIGSLLEPIAPSRSEAEGCDCER